MARPSGVGSTDTIAVVLDDFDLRVEFPSELYHRLMSVVESESTDAWEQFLESLIQYRRDYTGDNLIYCGSSWE